MKALIVALVLLMPSLAAADWSCTVTSTLGTYANGDKKLTLRCPKDTQPAIGTPVLVSPKATDPSPTPGSPLTITVAPGTGTLAAALAQAITAAKTQPVILSLSAGDYAGNLTLLRTNAPYPITITAVASLLPPAGTRATPTATHPRIVPSLTSTTTVLIQGDNYTFRGIEGATPDVGVTTFDLDATVTPRPSNITFDQVVIRGNATTGGHRGIGANGINVTITNSWIDRMWEVGRDSQAVAIWDAPGPLRIENNYLEAGSENILLGGAIPTCACVPTDVVITRNTLRKDPAWRTMSPSPQIKNLVEIKYGRRITITNNDIGNNWQQAQTGWSVLLTTMGVDGTAWSIVDTVTIAHNQIHDIANGLNIAPVSGPVMHVSVHDNVWRNIDGNVWGGIDDAGRWLMIQGGTVPMKTVSDVSITHESVIGITGNQFVGLYDNPIAGFVMSHVIAEHRDYGVFSSDGLAAAALVVHAPGGVFKDNAIVGPAADWLTWPAGNFTADVPIASQFDANGALLASSPLASLMTSDGVKVGAVP